MPSLTEKPALALVMLWCLLSLSLAGCGDDNSSSHYEPERGEHPDGWLPAGHAVAAFGHLETCTPCHGTDLNDPRGGISKVPCLLCHQGNATDVHPTEWGAHDYARHGEWVRQRVVQSGIAPSEIGAGALGTTLTGQARAATTGCATVYCHGTDYLGVANSGPSCFDGQQGSVDSSCHMGSPFSAHPLDWFPARFTTRSGIVPTILPAHGPYVITYGAAECSIPICHGSGTATVIRVGAGSTRITGTTPTTPNVGFTGFPGFTTATTETGTGPGEALVRNTGRTCAACHF